MLNLYITSTRQREGKTLLTTGLAAIMQSLGYKTSVYKPIQTGGIEINGFMQSPDLTVVKTVDPYIRTNFTYLFKTKAEPLISAELENKYIDIELINHEYSQIVEKSDCTIVDGDCGLMSPLAPNCQNIDLIKRIKTPVVAVVTPSENSINDILVLINSAQEKGILFRGVVINDIADDCPKYLLTSITRVIEEYSNVNVLGLLPHLRDKQSPAELISAVLNGVDIESIFDVKIAKLEFN